MKPILQNSGGSLERCDNAFFGEMHILDIVDNQCTANIWGSAITVQTPAGATHHWPGPEAMMCIARKILQ